MSWQPIETAPKDGTVILGCEWLNRHNREHEVVEVQWDSEVERWVLTATVWPDESWYADPTHWMPRPDAPPP